MLRPATPAEDRPAIWVDDRAVKVSVVSVEVAAEDRPPSWVAESLVAMALMSSLDRLEWDWPGFVDDQWTCSGRLVIALACACW